MSGWSHSDPQHLARIFSTNGRYWNKKIVNIRTACCGPPAPSAVRLSPVPEMLYFTQPTRGVVSVAESGEGSNCIPLNFELLKNCRKRQKCKIRTWNTHNGGNFIFVVVVVCYARSGRSLRSCCATSLVLHSWRGNLRAKFQFWALVISSVEKLQLLVWKFELCAAYFSDLQATKPLMYVNARVIKELIAIKDNIIIIP